MVYKSNEKTKDGRAYYFKVHYKDLYGINKTYKSKKYLTKQECSLEESRFRINIGENVKNSNITFNNIYIEYIDYLSKQLKPQSIRKLKPLWDNLEHIHNIKISNFNYSDYKKLLNIIEKKDCKVAYKNRIIGFLKRLINYSNKQYNTSAEILKHIEKLSSNEIKEEMKFFTYEDFKSFENVIEENDWKIFFQMLYYLGLRVGELQALQFKDIKNDKIYINKTLTTKLKGEEWYISTPKTKNSIRVLPLPKTLLNSLKMIKNDALKYKDYNENWFIFGYSHPFKNTTITNRKNKYCKLANLEPIRIHDFRHSCASYLLSKEHGNASIILVSKWLGHSNISMTLNTYTHLYKNELNDISNIIEKEI